MRYSTDIRLANKDYIYRQFKVSKKIHQFDIKSDESLCFNSCDSLIYLHIPFEIHNPKFINKAITKYTYTVIVLSKLDLNLRDTMVGLN